MPRLLREVPEILLCFVFLYRTKNFLQPVLDCGAWGWPSTRTTASLSPARPASSHQPSWPTGRSRGRRRLFGGRSAPPRPPHWPPPHSASVSSSSLWYDLYYSQSRRSFSGWCYVCRDNNYINPYPTSSIPSSRWRHIQGELKKINKRNCKHRDRYILFSFWKRKWRKLELPSSKYLMAGYEETRECKLSQHGVTSVSGLGGDWPEPWHHLTRYHPHYKYHHYHIFLLKFNCRYWYTRLPLKY